MHGVDTVTFFSLYCTRGKNLQRETNPDPTCCEATMLTIVPRCAAFKCTSTDGFLSILIFKIKDEP